MDYVVRGLSKKHNLLIYACQTTETVKKAQEIHKCTPTPLVALGRTVTASALLGIKLKGKRDTVTLYLTGNGPAKNLISVCDSEGNIKAYISNPEAEMPLTKKGRFNVPGILGLGELRIIRDLGLKEPYTGIIPLVYGEIGEDLAYYFLNSEQIPTIIRLWVDLDDELQPKLAGGYLIQLLPGEGDEKEETINMLEERMKEIDSLSVILEKYKTPEEILNYILDGVDEIEFLEQKEVRFQCDCSHERFYQGILSLGKEEIKSIFEKEDVLEAKCHFCNTAYHYKKDDFKGVLDD